MSATVEQKPPSAGDDNIAIDQEPDCSITNQQESICSTKTDGNDIGNGNGGSIVDKHSIYATLTGVDEQEQSRREFPLDDESADYEDDLAPHNNNGVSPAKENDFIKIQYNTSTPALSSTNMNDSRDSKILNASNSDLHSTDSEMSSSNGYNGNNRNSSSFSGTLSKDNGLNEDECVDGNQNANCAHSDEPEQMRKLFIGGLDYKTSEEGLKQHFEKFGDVLDCVVMREPQSKRSRGFGFVIYASSSMVDRAQDARPHEVDGREVQSKRAISREDSGKPEAQATVKKVYLGGLSDDIGEKELREYFKDFGNIVNVNIVAHKDTGKRRGFAFVEYDDYDPVDKIVLKKFHTVREKRIEAKKAIPKSEMDARKRVDPRAAMAGAMIAMSGPMDGPSGRVRGRNNGGNLWDGGHYSAGGYPAGYMGQAYGYPPHYHSPSAHYGPGGWVVQGGGPYGFRNSSGNAGNNTGGGSGGSYGNRNGYLGGQPSSGSWSTSTDYDDFPAAQGAGGPMRLSYQHRGWGPYGTGYGIHRGRGYNP